MAITLRPFFSVMGQTASGNLRAHVRIRGTDELGQLAKLINAAGEVTEYHYEAGQLVRLIHPDKTKEQMVDYIVEREMLFIDEIYFKHRKD